VHRHLIINYHNHHKITMRHSTIAMQQLGLLHYTKSQHMTLTLHAQVTRDAQHNEVVVNCFFY